MKNSNNQSERINLSTTKLKMQMPNLIEAQVESYNRFINEDLVRYIHSISPIADNTGKLWMLEFLDHEIRDALKPETLCLRKGLSYQAPLYWKVRLINKQTGEMKEQKVFMCEVPIMTERGSFIINGVERCIVHQIIRAEGVIFLPNNVKIAGQTSYLAKIIPEQGPWFTIDTAKTGVISIKLGPRRGKVNILTFLRAMGYSSDEQVLNLFKDIKVEEGQTDFIQNTLAKDTTTNQSTAILDIYKKLRPDITASVESAKEYLDNLILDTKRLKLGEIGRYQLNKKLDDKFFKEINEENLGLKIDDIIGITVKLIKTNLGLDKADDVDHLGNRRIRSVNELLGEVITSSIRKIEKNTKDKMSLHSTDELLTANDVLSSRPLTSAFNDFFGTSQISRFMGQKNILTEISNLRHITASGPGGLSKERATFSVRDIHYSQYGRFCAIHTPDGVNIGVVTHLAAYAKINKYGFIEVPYKKLIQNISVDKSENRILNEDIKDSNEKIVIARGTKIDKKVKKQLKNLKIGKLNIKPFVSEELVYMDADDEFAYKLTTAKLEMDEHYNILQDSLPIRYQGEFIIGSASEVDYIDVDTNSMASVNLASIPFAQNCDAARAGIAASNLNQALPLVRKESPIVGTGREREIAVQSRRNVYAISDGEISYVDGQKIILKPKKGKEKVYNLSNFDRSNDNTLLHQVPTVSTGHKVSAGDLLAEGSCSADGEMAIGTNLLCSTMFYEGLTFEDGWAISERILKKGNLEAVLIKSHIRDLRDTKLGPEKLTGDIPGVNEALLANLEDTGIVRKGAYVKGGDILAGMISPKGETDISPEEKLLRAIFGESATEIRDVSLRMPHGESGIVIDTQVIDREEEELSAGVLKQIRIWTAKTHSIHIGDKLCDMFGQKGVISKIIPEEDMPYLPDGRPIDLIFNPLFIKRMNISLLKEMYLGMKATEAGVKVAAQAFTDIDESAVDKILKEKGLEVKPKSKLFDGRSGEAFYEEVAYGIKYMLKLTHLAEEKIHARSTGPYTIITQQPLGGKAQQGGQRFGEMEVWALEAHGVPHLLHEMLTIKSDDVSGRSAAYESIVHGETVKLQGVPESFKVIINEFRALGLNIIILNKDGEEIHLLK